MRISFQSPNCCFLAEFNQSPAAQEIIKHLPLDAQASRWQDEIYFETNITAADKSTLEVNVGDIAYWPEGKCICVFFGPTPASSTGKPVPASPVVIIGKTDSRPDELRKIKEGDQIKVIQAPQDFFTVYHRYKNKTPGDRKLTQEEIDVLVQGLLAEKENCEKEKQGQPL
jgi:hypothetical protein